MDNTSERNITTVSGACSDSSESKEVMIPEVLVTQYIAEDNRMTDDEEIADPLADMNETLHEIVLEYLSHEESEGNDSNDEDLSFEIVVTDSSINEIAKVYKSQYEENNAHQFSTAQRYD